MEIYIKDTKITFYISDNNCHIVDSYLIRDEIKELFLKTYLLLEDVFKTRSFKSYMNEWRAHNILYKWNVARKRTKDVDLNINESLFRRIGYCIISNLFKSLD